MLSRAAILLLLVVLFALGVGIFFARKEFQPGSSPNAPRVNPTYDETFTPITPRTSTPPEQADPPVEVKTNKNNYIILVDRPLSEKPSLPFKLHRVHHTNVVKVGDGKVRLASLAVGYTNHPGSFDDSIKVHPFYFTPELKPITTNQLKSIGIRPSRYLEFRGQFPKVELKFALDDLPPLKFMGFQVFDSKTKLNLTTGHGSSFQQNTLQIQTDLKTWRQTPLELVLTLGIGPTIPFNLKPDERKQLLLPHGRIQLVAVFPHEINTWGSGMETNRTRMTLSGNTNSKPVVTFAFVCLERLSDLPIDIEFYDKENKKLPSHGMNSSDQIILASYAGTIEQIERLQVNYYPNVHRMVFNLPALPNLPEENANLKNLFDTRVPYVRIQSETSLKSMIEILTAMEIKQVPLSFPPGYFPREYTNVTPTVLLADLTTGLPKNRGNLVVDNKKHEIRFEDGFLNRIWERVKTILP